MILNRAKDYYENDKERLKKQARDKCKNLSDEEKNRYYNMSKKKKRTLKECPKNYREAKRKK